jgi:ABC-2 type transport system ATP-binding protein
MEVIRAEKITKCFGEVTALDEVVLRVKNGVFGLIGPNGAGKTTFIRILLGHLKPDAGRCHVFGLDSWNNSFEIRKKVGVLHEKPSYPAHQTCFKFLEFVGKIYGVGNPSARAVEVLKLVGLFEHRVANRPIGKLSAGMLQRLGVAQALIGEPKLVILDEPTSNLDVLGRMDLLSNIRKIHRDEGVNFFICSHVLSELEEVCTEVAIIKSGRILESGAVDSLIKKYCGNVYLISTSEPALLVTKLKAMSYIEDVEVKENEVMVKLKDESFCEKFLSDVVVISKKAAIKVNSVTMAGALKEVFKRIVGE